MSARGTITSSAVVSRSRSTLAISSRSCRSSSGCSPGFCCASAASCTSSAIEFAQRMLGHACGPAARCQSRPTTDPRCPLMRASTGWARRCRAESATSAISMRRASPGWSWSSPCRCNAAVHDEMGEVMRRPPPLRRRLRPHHTQRQHRFRRRLFVGQHIGRLVLAAMQAFSRCTNRSPASTTVPCMPAALAARLTIVSTRGTNRRQAGSATIRSIASRSG